MEKKKKAKARSGLYLPFSHAAQFTKNNRPRPDVLGTLSHKRVWPREMAHLCTRLTSTGAKHSHTHLAQLHKISPSNASRKKQKMGTETRGLDVV